MRDYAKLSSLLWTGRTGVKLRLHPDAQRIAAYLIGGPNASMTGLYYLPLPTLCHEVGVKDRRARLALEVLQGFDFSFYDEPESLMWVPGMARIQVGEFLPEKDNRIKAIIKMVKPYLHHRFSAEFVRIYAKPYHLEGLEPEVTINEDVKKPLLGPLLAPTEPLRSQKKEQEQKKEQNKKPLAEPDGSTAFTDFWKLYPRKVKKLDAWKAWCKAKLDSQPELTSSIDGALKAQIQAGVFANMQYAPHPASWLNGRRWEDEVADSNGRNPHSLVGSTAERQPGPTPVQFLVPGQFSVAEFYAKMKAGVPDRISERLYKDFILPVEREGCEEVTPEGLRIQLPTQMFVDWWEQNIERILGEKAEDLSVDGELEFSRAKP